MKRNLKELKGYSLEAKDGIEGKVKDFLFDEERWIIRYLEADLGTLFSSDKVLISKTFLKEPDWRNSIFPVELDKSDLEKSPRLESDLPVSRKYEEKLNKSYKLVNYWEQPYVPPVGVGAMGYMARPIKVPTKKIDEKNIDTNLRSFEEVMDYTINAKDGKLGHIENLIIDDEDWQIVYAVVDTKNWLPWSKKVLIAIQWMEEISYVNKEVKINLNTDTIKNAPEYDESKLIDELYEKSYFNYYGQ
jgi:hypothetical protein